MGDQGNEEPPKFTVIEGGGKPPETFPLKTRGEKADDLRKHAANLLTHKPNLMEYFLQNGLKQEKN